MQVHSFMASLTCLRSVETNLTVTCPSLKSFVCNLPDSGRYVAVSRSVGRVGENPENEVGALAAKTITFNSVSYDVGVACQTHEHGL